MLLPQALLAQFQRAAEAVAEQQMSVEDRISKYLRRWCDAWEHDLEGRPDEIKETHEGKGWVGGGLEGRGRGWGLQ